MDRTDAVVAPAADMADTASYYSYSYSYTVTTVTVTQVLQLQLQLHSYTVTTVTVTQLPHGQLPQGYRGRMTVSQ